jgi:hypothetical protein
MRIGSLICLLLVVGMLYSRARRPETWAWLVNEGTDAAPTEKGPAPPTRVAAAPAKADKSAAPRTPDAAPKNDPGKQAAENGGGFPEKAAPPAQGGDKSAVAVGSTVPPTDTIIPGPTDKDPEEQADVRAQFELLTDREALEAIEMPAYWRLFRWAWAQSFSEMERRANRDVMYVHLYDQPDKFRGKLVRLKLHIVRIVKWDAEENKGKFKHIYEVWGATEDSQSFPYVAVVSELPPGMKPGATVRYDGIFVGYFLKNMAYKAHDVLRGTPLLIGRLHALNVPGQSAKNVTADNSMWQWLTGIGIAVVVGIWLWLRFARVRGTEAVVHKRAESEMEAWLKDAPTAPLAPGSEFTTSLTEPPGSDPPLAPSTFPPPADEPNPLEKPASG